MMKKIFISVRQCVFIAGSCVFFLNSQGQTAFNIQRADYNALREYYLFLSRIDDPKIEVIQNAGIENAEILVEFEGASIQLRSFSKNPHGLQFLILHNNENTGKAAALQYIAESGGRLLCLEYGSSRYLNFFDSVNNYNIDPNHIFSENGICNDINRWSFGIASAQTFEKVQSLSEKILEAYNVSQTGYILTLHNNTEGGFSIHSYLKEDFFKSCAAAVFVNPEMDPDDMVIVTDRYFFEYLKAQNINVVLQSPVAPDDGSLSWYAMQHKIPYANIEVQFGHKTGQLRLITVVGEMLNEYPASMNQLLSVFPMAAFGIY